MILSCKSVKPQLDVELANDFPENITGWLLY